MPLGSQTFRCAGRRTGGPPPAALPDCPAPAPPDSRPALLPIRPALPSPCRAGAQVSGSSRLPPDAAPPEPADTTAMPAASQPWPVRPSPHWLFLPTAGLAQRQARRGQAPLLRNQGTWLSRTTPWPCLYLLPCPDPARPSGRCRSRPCHRLRPRVSRTSPAPRRISPALPAPARPWRPISGKRRTARSVSSSDTGTAPRRHLSCPAQQLPQRTTALLPAGRLSPAGFPPARPLQRCPSLRQAGTPAALAPCRQLQAPPAPLGISSRRRLSTMPLLHR